MGAFLRKYATVTTLNFPLISFNSVSFTSTASLTTADMKLSLNEGAFTTVGTAITNVGSYGYSYTMTTADLTAARVMMVVVNTASPKTFEDTMILIETYGSTGAQHTFDLSIANQTVIASAGTVIIGASGLSAGALVAGAFSAGAFAAGFLSAGGIAAAAISAGGIAASAISAGGIATAAITSAKIATGGLDSTNFGVGFLSAGGIAASAISLGGFATGAIDSTKFVAGAIDSVALNATAINKIWNQAAVPSTAVPAWTASMLSTISFLLALGKNTIQQTSVLQTVLQSDGVTTLATGTLSDDGVTFSKGSFN